jgi:hypothetical protein
LRVRRGKTPIVLFLLFIRRTRVLPSVALAKPRLASSVSITLAHRTLRIIKFVGFDVVKRASPVFGRLCRLDVESPPRAQIDLLDVAVEALDLDRAIVDGHDAEHPILAAE